MSLDERVSEVIKRIYCAGDRVDQWEALSDQIMTLTGATGALATLVDLDECEFGARRLYGRDHTAIAIGLDEYACTYKDDPTLVWASENPNARFCDSLETLPKQEYVTNDFVQWFSDRFRSRHWCVGYSPADEDLSFSFSVHFPSEQGTGSSKSVRLFRMLFDHLECSVLLARRPFNPESARCLLILNADGKVAHISTAADALLRTAGALRVVGSRLQAADVSQQAKLDQAFARVTSAMQTGAGPMAIKIDHPSGKRPWIVAIRPLVQGVGPFNAAKCQLFIEIHDHAPRIESVELMQSLFDLTSRELEVVRLLADGHSIESLAHAMAISANTARTHMRAIFTKTKTNRQSELLQLCAALART